LGSYAQIAGDPFPELAAVEGDHQRCAAFIDRLAELSAKVGLPRRLRDVGIREEDIAGLARDAMKQTRLLVNNPRDVTEPDARSIYQAAW
jgi:alcohol dehydrogenase class IV